MISRKTVAAIFLGATICLAAESISISGVVRDRAGAAIPGATVRLEKANISTMTGHDGRFTLTNPATQLRQSTKNNTKSASPVQLQKGKISIILSGAAPVAISIYTVSGRQIFRSKQTYGSGMHTISVPFPSAGIWLFRVTIGNNAYSFKSSPSGACSPAHGSVSGGRPALGKQAKPALVIEDVILVFKEGQIHYREAVEADDATIEIQMVPNADTVTDADGNVYQSVRIGNQIWTVENLRTTKYNDGTPIQYVTDDGSEGWRKQTTGAYCYYENNTANRLRYGALYNWFAIQTGKLAPEGWHVPTNAEWDTLQNYLIANGYNWDGTTSGNKIAKSLAAKLAWCSSAIPGTTGAGLCTNNTSGFAALPGGCRDVIGVFHDKDYIGYWWSAAENADMQGFLRCVADSSLYRYVFDEGNLGFGSSVRLLRD